MSTSLAYGELLAFEGLQGSVEHLYRVYLDAVLVQLKRDAGADSTVYWDRVAEFRRIELEPEAALRAFYYWYDVRARFWASQEAEPFALSAFPYADEIDLLHTQAKALKARLYRMAQLEDLAAQKSQATRLYKPQQQFRRAAASTEMVERLINVDRDPLKVI